ncbi:YdeI/OmpD-associated family protein [Microbacterium sp. 10M-3C3]|jgi:hypothetical protein|uniref:YdeI/OmpD-associated family protein n=1 Tax=Microbacterium sp. 10M-3C3 TaxID=2483401 RepID=UPI000F6303F4|nr:YdeI/OmpD-associated family protein [Microbacterium sp. 10M-3C3]
MAYAWPIVGPSCAIAGLVEPMPWGKATYTVLRVPEELVSAAAEGGTRRVAGRLEDVEVNLALNRAPVLPDVFVWAGASLLRRLRLDVGDPVSGELAPVDDAAVLVPADVTQLLADAGATERWEMLTPADRRRRLATIDAAATAATRARRIHALIAAL